MAEMSIKDQTFTEAEVDEIVETQAQDDTAWGKPTRVQRKARLTSLTLASELAARASFIARLHGEKRVEDWLARVIQERVALEEAIFAELKRDLTTKNVT
jgi:hypothetical protein